MTSANRLRTTALALTFALGMGAALPSHAFLGWLGKAGKAAAAAGKVAEGGAEAANAASKAAKAGKAAEAANTAGKAGAAGAATGAAAAGGAELAAASTRHGLVFAADDAAHLAGKAPMSVADKAVLAATPPEVSRYLTLPSNMLSSADSAQMLSLYKQMMGKAAKTGDFTVVERMPSLHNTPKAVDVPVAQAPAAMTSAATSSIPAAELSFHALRLLSHAANSQHNTAAMRELQSYCKNKPAATWQPEHAELCTNVPKKR